MRLATKGKFLGRKALRELASMVTPKTKLVPSAGAIQRKLHEIRSCLSYGTLLEYDVDTGSDQRETT